MTAVIFYGKSVDGAAESIKNILCKNGGAIYCNKNRLSIKTGNERYLIVESDHSIELDAPSGIIIFLNKISLHGPDIPNGFVAVTESSNHEALELLSKSETKTITCGMAAADTVTLSSVKEDSAVISLQRHIKTLTGKVLEPGDFPVKLFNKVAEYPLAAAAAVLLLSDFDISLASEF